MPASASGGAGRHPMPFHRLIAAGLLALCLLGAGLQAELALQEKVGRLPFDHQGPFVRTSDGMIWAMNATGALVSANEGQTWEHRSMFDSSRFQSRGERALLRTREGVLLSALLNQKEAWSQPSPLTIEASDSPGMLTRLESGRTALVWNRFRDPAQRTGRREALSISFSENDGLTWTVPQVIAMNPVPAGKREGAYWISYPYIFESVPGILWISTMQGRLNVALNEGDFIRPVDPPLEEAAVRIVTLGDSITKGARKEVKPTETFAALLQAGLRAQRTRVDVHNVGIGGERTDQVLLRLDREIISQRPHLVTVMYGTNDSWVDTGRTASRLTEEQYEANLREIVRRLRAARIQVLLMTPPKFAEGNPKNGLGEDPNVRLGRYVERCRTVAQDTGVPLVDHFGGWAAEQDQGRALQAWTTDGCHPNSAGHADLAGRLLSVISPLVTKLFPAP